MRTFRIDYTQENKLPDGDVVGKFGEHNATLLSITPPQEMTECDNIAYYRIAFGLTNYRTVHSGTLEKSENISLALFSQITRSDTISVQLIGYGADDSLVMKSETVKKLKFAESVGGTEVAFEGGSRNLGAEVVGIKNKLNNFSEDANGNLLYKGKPLAAEERSATPFVLSGENGEYFLSYLNGSYIIVDATDTFQNGTEIKSIEISYKGDWVNLYDISRFDGSPVLINMFRVTNEIGSEGTVLATLYVPLSEGVLMTMLLYNECDIKVTVYNEVIKDEKIY